METGTTQSPEVESVEGAGWLTPRRCFLLIALLGTVCFANGLTGDFVQDDFLVVVRNSEVHSLQNVFKLFTLSYWGKGSESFGAYRPLTNVSHALVHAVFGLLPLGYHLGNLILHVFNGWLVFLLARRYTGRALIALPTALVFIAHPVHVEAVTQVVGRTELLASMFFFLAWLFYLSGEENPRFQVFSWLCFTAALFSKENTVVLLGVIPLAEFCARKGTLKTLTLHWARVCLPYLGGFAVYLTARWLALGGLGVKTDQSAFKGESVTVRWLTMVDGFRNYFRLLVFPSRLCADYEFSVIPMVFSPTLSTMIGLALIIAIIAVGFWGIFRKPAIGFGVLFFFVSISVVSNIAISTGFLIAERVLYLPCLGICFLAGLLFSDLYSRKPAFRPVIVGIFCLLCGLMAWRDIVRNRDWADGPTFSAALRRDAPRNYKGWIALGEERTDPASKEAAFRKAVEVEPNRSVTHLALGKFLILQGRTPEGMAELRRGYEIFTRSEDLCYWLAIGSLREGNEIAALDWLERARGLAPRKASLFVGLASEFVQRKKYDTALDLYRKALEIGPREPAVFEGIGLIFLFQGRYAEAEQAARAGIGFAPESDSLHANLGVSLLAQGKTEEARAELVAALRLNPGSRSAVENLKLIERQRVGN